MRIVIVIVTGTGTGVGKTIVTAALASCFRGLEARVAVVKPVQTGVTADEPGDAQVVANLSGCASVHELVRLDDPLAPDTAARLRGLSIPRVNHLADSVAAIAAEHDVTVVEGAGGVAVRLDTDRGTIVSLAHALVDLGLAPRFVVVTGLSLGTLNHTALTVGALRAAGFDPAGLILGSVAPTLGLAESCNVHELPRVTGVPLRGRIPAGVAGWEPDRFRREAVGWLDCSALLGLRRHPTQVG